MTSIWKLARKSFLSICFIAMLAVTSLVPGTSAYAGTVDLLPGRWTGYGKKIQDRKSTRLNSSH